VKLVYQAVPEGKDQEDNKVKEVNLEVLDQLVQLVDLDSEAHKEKEEPPVKWEKQDQEALLDSLDLEDLVEDQVQLVNKGLKDQQV